MTQLFNQKLQLSTRAKLERFNSLRGREVQSAEFWDVVVLTAVDESQRAAYELQVRAKVDRGELPLGIQYKVFSDPPGNKVGNGGSTLFVLQNMNDIYGAALSRMRVIVIHAGGFSQRLPSASALGKIFSALPLGDPLYQMLELKLAMYVDFPSHMAPGVLVTCADDIELYSIPEDHHVKFDRPGFTALAHPSPLSIGTTHGVFVLDSAVEKSSDSEMENSSCLRFLHKPSVKEMHERGAVYKTRSCPSLPEYVYTDSTYYFDHGTTKTLLGMLKELEPLQCEIDAYGDFLQALGPGATIDYTSNMANVAKEERGLVWARKQIFQHLRGTPLNVVLLNNSKFYHIGTTAEFLFHLTQDEALRGELGLMSSAFSVHASGSPNRCCVMYSVLDPGCSVGSGSVVEYSRMATGASVGECSIVSSCWVGAGLRVPDNVFMHSLCIDLHQSQVGFVTVAFGIDDNLKRCVDRPADAGCLKLFGLSLSQCLSRWGRDLETLGFSGDSYSCSLWNARLFPVCPDQRSSFAASLEMLQVVLGGFSPALPKDTEMMSMQECLHKKNLEGMMDFRTGLYNDITQRTHSH